ncbi:MAG: hypothetical protein JNJ48_06485 [Phycisphaerae bacterium]|nr:hypothetical protein [Phycisphaerae bacterium]
MKSASLSVALILAVGGTAAVAQPGGGGGGGRGPGGGGMGMMMMGGMGGMGGRMGAPFSPSDVDKFAPILNLTEEQKEAAKTLLTGHLAGYQEKADEFRKEMDRVREEFRETRDPSVWGGLREAGTKLAEARKAMETAYVADLKAILNDDQIAAWPRVEMMRRREQTINMGLMAGERVDVIRIVDQLKPAPEVMETLRPILDAYAGDVDRALQKRNELYERGMQQGMEMFQNGDTAGIQKMFEEAREASTAVRDTNRRYARQVEGALPPELAAKFAAEFKRESFPQVYRDRYAAQALKAAAAFDDLDEAQKASIASLMESYQRDSASLNEKGEKATEAQEAAFNPAQMMQRGPGGGGGFGDNPAMQEYRTARRDLDNRTVEALKAILNEQQRTRLPEQGGGGDGGPRMRQGGDNNNGDQMQRRRGNNGNTPRANPPQQPRNN